MIHPLPADNPGASRRAGKGAFATARWQPLRHGVSSICVCGLVGLCFVGLSGFSSSPEPAETLFKAEDFPDGWSHHSAENGRKLGDVWQAVKGTGGKDDVLICRGKPFGYLRTRKQYENFEFRLEWMYPDNPNGNSGVLVFTHGQDKIWPDAVQVQLHAPTAGSIFPSGDATSETKLMTRDLSKPAGQWNTCLITARGGRVSVTINGKKAGEVTGCKPSKGSIALQSEGSEVHFRRMKLRPLQ